MPIANSPKLIRVITIACRFARFGIIVWLLVGVRESLEAGWSKGDAIYHHHREQGKQIEQRVRI